MGSSLAGEPMGFDVMVADENGDGLEASLTWGLQVTGVAARVDVFLDTSTGGGLLAGGTVTPDNIMGVGFPAVSDDTIAVGSYVTQSSWTIDGKVWDSPDPLTGAVPNVGALSLFSSVGPARDAVHTGLKPDITAPGEMVASAYNASAPDDVTGLVVLAPPNGYVLLAGTSMASPCVTGVVALLLSQHPQLGVSDVRNLLTKTAAPVTGVNDLPDTRWGAGKVDAFAAMLQLLQTYPVDGGALDAALPGVDATADSGGSLSPEPEDASSTDGSVDETTDDSTANPDEGDATDGGTPPDATVAGDDGSQGDAPDGTLAASDAGGEAGSPDGALALGDGASKDGTPSSGTQAGDAAPAENEASIVLGAQLHSTDGCSCRMAPRVAGRECWIVAGFGGLFLVRRRRRRGSLGGLRGARPVDEAGGGRGYRRPQQISVPGLKRIA